MGIDAVGGVEPAGSSRGVVASYGGLFGIVGVRYADVFAQVQNFRMGEKQTQIRFSVSFRYFHRLAGAGGTGNDYSGLYRDLYRTGGDLSEVRKGLII